MPRRKEYDRNAVLLQAMKVFWERGYNGTSIQDLVDATGLNRFGMYQAFESKESLFLEALDKYRDEVMAENLEELLRAPPGLPAIKSFLTRYTGNSRNGSHPTGCMMTNTAIDFPILQENALKKVKSHLRRMENALQKCLNEAVQQKEIPNNANTKALARYLVGVVQGLLVCRRVNTGKDQLDSMIEVALSNLQKRT